jgi:AcrR family transcriptional regulator
VKTDRRATRWDEHRAARREALVDATIGAVRELGPGVGMDEVAGRARTSKTVVYRHFADRADLYAAVCARVADVLVTQIRAATDAAVAPRDRVAAGIDAYLRLIEHDPQVYRFVMHRAAADTPVTDLVTLIGDDVARAIAAIRPGPAAVPWGHGIVGLVRGAADHWLAHPAGMTRAALAAHLTDLAWAGLSGLAA